MNKNEPPLEDSGFYFVAAKAIELVSKDFIGERRPYNVAVLPAPDNQLYIYVYPAQTKVGVYPLGGDVRYLISPDGEKIVEKRQMHKSIMDWTPDVPKGGTVAAGPRRISCLTFPKIRTCSSS